MTYKKDQEVHVVHERKGNFSAKVAADTNTSNEEWITFILPDESEMTCRISLCKITLIKD